MKLFLVTVLLILGIVLCVLAVRAGYYSAQARHWPTTVGQVIESGVARSALTNKLYRPVVRYRYQVNHVDYEHQRLFFTALPWPSHFATANAISRDYVPGALINVRHHGGNPQQAVLVVNNQWLRELGLGVLSIIIASLLLILFKPRIPIAPRL